MILNGDLDEIPERFFYMTGTIDQVVASYEKSKRQSKDGNPKELGQDQDKTIEEVSDQPSDQEGTDSSGQEGADK
jgi:hypothetical protein